MSDPNPHLTPKRGSLPRDMTTWDYDAIKRLFEGNDEFALFSEHVDHVMVFFWAHDRFWLFSRPPTGGWDDAAPETVTDWIGASADKEPGAEPVLMHREELPASAETLVERVEDDPPEHPYDYLDRVLGDDNDR